MVHVTIDTSEVSINDVEYETGTYLQRGGGAYFHGVPFQRGGGIGGTLMRFWRFLVPLVKPIAKEIGKEGLHAGARILENVADGQRLADAVVEQGRASARALARRVQAGGGGRRRKRVTLNPSTLRGRLCSVSVPNKKLRRDALGLY